MANFGPRAPQFNDGDDSYHMDAPESVDTERIRERIRDSKEFIQYLKSQSYLPEDTEHIEELFETAWVTLWNHFVAIYEASEKERLKSDLFDKPKWGPWHFFNSTGGGSFKCDTFG